MVKCKIGENEVKSTKIIAALLENLKEHQMDLPGQGRAKFVKFADIKAIINDTLEDLGTA